MLTYYLLGFVLVPALLLAIYAETKVSTTYNKYKNTTTTKGMSGHEVARLILDTAGYREVTVNKVSGLLTDNYDPRTKSVNLSSATYENNSIASIGIASHEVGHAIQDMSDYKPIKLRQLVVKVSNISSRVLWPIIIIGFLLDIGYSLLLGKIFIYAGIIFFGISTILNLITVQVEFNASKRAIQILRDSHQLTDSELSSAKEVLHAAALTYLAALLVSILQLVRFILYIALSTRNSR